MGIGLKRMGRSNHPDWFAKKQDYGLCIMYNSMCVFTRNRTYRHTAHSCSPVAICPDTLHLLVVVAVTGSRLEVRESYELYRRLGV